MASLEDLLDLSPNLERYRTQKAVIISSRWLKVPHMIMSACALGYITWCICADLKFMDSGSVIVNAAIRLQEPLLNYATCVDDDMDCEFRKLNSSLPYCQRQGIAPGMITMWDNNSHRELERHVDGCREVDIHEADLPGDKLLIPTMITEFHQRRCTWDWECEHAHRGWFTYKILGHFVADIESYTLSLTHTYQVDQLGMRGKGVTEQGFLRDHSGNAFLITCTSNCDHVSFRWNESHEDCGSHLQHDGDACFASHRGDVLSVRRLLGATDIDLDRPRPEFGNLSFRVTGLGLGLDIVYDNLEGFWRWPWGAKTRYTYKPSLSNFGVEEELYKTHVRQSGEHHRILQRQTGIALRVHGAGTLGRISFSRFVLCLAGFLALLKCADLVTERALVPLYSLFPRTAHIPHYFRMHKVDLSMAVDRFQERRRRLAALREDGYELCGGAEQSFLTRNYSEIPKLPEGRCALSRKDSGELSESSSAGRHDDLEGGRCMGFMRSPI